MSTSQGTLKTAGATRGGTDFPSEPPEGTYTANTFILDVRPPKLRENQFSLFDAPQFVVTCYSSHGNLM